MYLNRIEKCASAVVFFFVLALIPALASAEPLGFKRPRSTFSFGFDVFDAMLGDFGNASDVGMSVFADATIQFGGYFGAHVRFGSARAFTRKDFLPFDNGYQFIYMTVAPRFYFSPFRKLTLYFFAQPEVALQALVSNTLVKVTGNDDITGAAGGSLGLQFLLGIISVTAQVSCQYNWNLQTVFLGGSLSVGLSNTI
ncbi:MAG: hypothetical protein II767_00665 [Proteobacteria bacterium]|nr:hypothetical protein [Pseudomonadota bacterium]MBQ4358748.1 hypothetical protein [Pseudomonadota bacterium]